MILHLSKGSDSFMLNNLNWLLKPTNKKSDYIIKSSPLLIEDKKYSLLIGQFPMGLIKNGGSPIKSDESLSIENFLRELKVRSIGQEIFPWAHSNNSHWIYYALFNGTYNWNKKLNGDDKIAKLKIALKYLDSIGKKRSGAGRTLKEGDGKKKWARIFDDAVNNHKIITPIKNQELFKSIRKKITDHYKISKSEKNIFKKLWISQSNHLTGKIANKNKTIGQCIADNANKSNPIDSVYRISYHYKYLSPELNTLLAAFLTIRAIYGQTLEHEPNIESVKKAAEEAIKLFNHLKYKSQHFDIIRKHLKYAAEKGIPVWKDEAIRISSEKRIQLFRSFRLHSFLKIIRQLEEV